MHLSEHFLPLRNANQTKSPPASISTSTDYALRGPFILSNNLAVTNLLVSVDGFLFQRISAVEYIDHA